ncbi:MAG: AAA family ATPase [Patescibacteria group bacterium]|jgi:adenylate kinase family enzyme
MLKDKTTLIVLRGPSGSGKSSAAKEVRAAWESPMALIEQDYLRRTLLKEKDIPNGLNIELIKRTVLFALENSVDVILEGILDNGRYLQMFEEILQKHPKNNHFFYFDVSLDETLRRHQFKPNKNDFGEKEMRAWYKDRDFLSCVKEKIVSEANSLEQTREFILKVCVDAKKEKF